MGKVKVSREIAEALSLMKKGDEEVVFDTHLVGWVSPSKLCLNELTPLEMAEILINGYEVEETPEEKLFSLHRDYSLVVKNNATDNFGKGYEAGLSRAIKILGLKEKK